MQLDIEAEHDVLARDRIGALEHPQYPAPCIGFDFLVTHLAVQLGFIEAFDARFANVMGAAVVDRIEGFKLFLVDPPHITHRVRKVRALGVMTHQLGNHLNPGQAELVHGNPGDLFFIELKQDGHRLKWPAPLLHALFEQGAIFWRELQHFNNNVEHLLPVTRAFTGHAQTEAGTVVRDHHTITVKDQTASRRDRLHMHPVIF